MNKNQLTYHHKLTQSWGGRRNVDNCDMLKWNIHRAVHLVFEDNTPLGRHIRLLNADDTTYIPDAYEELNGVLRRLHTKEIEIYKPHIFNRDKFLLKQKQKGK